MSSNLNIDICLSPELIHLFDLKEKNAVVIDIFRASSTMTCALANGLESVIPVSEVDECKAYPASEKIIKAAERDGKKVEGFQYGNSPYDYIGRDINGKCLIMTTTNGTKAIHLSKPAKNVIIGSFLNFSSVCDFLMKDKKDVILICAGWKGNYNLEDTLFAAAVIDELEDLFSFESDAVMSSLLLLDQAEKTSFSSFLSNSAHHKRLKSYKNIEDIKYCLEFDRFDILPIVKDNKIVVA